MQRRFSQLLSCVVILWILPSAAAGENLAQFIRQNYIKQSFKVPVRDGAHLYTIVYAPRDTTQKYPILLTRTPYGVHPYEDDIYRASLGPSGHFPREGYIFVYQDVRGRYMSEGTFENVRPHNPRRGPRDIDESTDTYDTIDWLVKNVANHNGKVGMWGISYPGFYCSAGMIDAHPALKAVSPQAPIADWFFDDFFHHGAFFLSHAFNFFTRFGDPRPEPTTKRGQNFDWGTNDGYQFFLDPGPLKNLKTRHFKNRIPYWDTLAQHPNYDEFWRARNLLPHLKKVAPAVLTVGGWFDAEDLYGALKTYQVIERQNPRSFNVLVMGPWSHGGWSRGEASLGTVDFGPNTANFFQREMELPFFNHFLKGKGEHGLPEATMFETGRNRWRRFAQWPPPEVAMQALYLGGRGRLSPEPPPDDEGFDSFPSDPNRPVPYTQALTTGMAKEYMVEDQRFASRRPDVLVYQTGPLPKDLTLAGPLRAELIVSTTGSDADWIVKLIDVAPSGFQMLVRSEVIRGRLRNSYERPEPFVPGKPSRVALELQDVLHTFGKGHRLMVQIHSTWFPLVDRNPQTFVANIFEAEEKDFVAATHRVYRSKRHASAVHVGVLQK